jgi:hypothetical protein
MSIRISSATRITGSRSETAKSSWTSSGPWSPACPVRPVRRAHRGVPVCPPGGERLRPSAQTHSNQLCAASVERLVCRREPYSVGALAIILQEVLAMIIFIDRPPRPVHKLALTEPSITHATPPTTAGWSRVLVNLSRPRDRLVAGRIRTALSPSPASPLKRAAPAGFRSEWSASSSLAFQLWAQQRRLTAPYPP